MPGVLRGDPNPPRVGFWLGLLLLFVPVFYFLLWLKPYSPLARTGWGLWLGLIVFVKASGLSEPVINLSEIERQLAEQQQAGEPVGGPARAPAPAGAQAPQEPEVSQTGGAAPDLHETFVGEEEPRPEVALEDYLRRLGGGILGRLITAYEADGDTLRVAFKEADWFLEDERAIGLESMAAAFALFYGRGFGRVVLDYTHQGQPVRLDITRAAFNDFFAMSDGDMRALADDRERFRASPLANMPKPEQQAFFERFAEYR